ncbi:hypothetical protein ABPG75_010590 [Micractinium tetrahymenae]
MGAPKKKGPGGKKKPARPPQQLTAEEHYENAEMAFTMENFELARTSFKRALDMEPENIEFLEGYGSFLAEVGPQSEAVTVLQHAVALEPDEGFEKYMYLGQLVEGPEAEQHVRKGVAVLRKYIEEQAAQPQPAEGSEEAADAAEEKEHLDATLCSCLCSLAEVLLTKSQQGEAGVAGVAAEVEALLGEARHLSPASPEPLQSLASLRQQQGKDEEALGLLRQSLALWFKPAPEEPESEGEEEGAKAKEGEAAKKAAAAEAAEEEEELGSQDSDSEEGNEEDRMEFEEGSFTELPSYEFRFETAKLLLELDDTVDAASQVLEQLLEENDQDPNVWLLLAMCYQGGGDLESALEAAEHGLQLCRQLGLPAGDEMLAGFEAVQNELQAMIEGEKKEAKAAEKGAKGKQ